MKIAGTTRVAGIFGYPVEHSLSPTMHNAAFEHLKLDHCYVAFSVKPEALEDAVGAIRALNLTGVNVTVPHKESVLPFLDELSEEASRIRAVNTIHHADGRLVGHNTDGRGFLESLAEAGISAGGKRILVVGAGGASRSVSYALSKQGSQVEIFGRDPVKIGKLVERLCSVGATVRHRGTLDDLADIDIIVNTTPLGMRDSDALPLDVSLLARKAIVCDLIYRTTPFLRAAAERGCKTLDGLGMLLHQGALAFEIWTGKKAPVDVMREALMSAMR